jgi:hypothetical protein
MLVTESVAVQGFCQHFEVLLEWGAVGYPLILGTMCCGPPQENVLMLTAFKASVGYLSNRPTLAKPPGVNMNYFGALNIHTLSPPRAGIHRLARLHSISLE